MNHKNLHKRLAALLLVLCLVVCNAAPAFAASAASIQLGQKGSIHIALYDRQNSMAVRGGELTLYKVADLQRKGGDVSYVYTGYFKGCGIALDDLTDASLPTKLEQVLPVAAEGTTKSVGEDGTVTFENLSLGLYLVVQTEASRGYAAINSFVVSVPLEEDGSWLYDVEASPKVGTITPSPEPEEPDTPDTPPETPETPDIPVIPTTPDTPVSPGHPDTPVMPENPDNPVSPGHPDNPVMSGLPQTGQLNWPVPVLALSGVVLFAFGWVLDKKAKAL